MHVVVCLKQVPDSTNVRINPETNTLMREGVEAILNPFDEYALEAALAVKDATGAKVTALSMGPPQAQSVLRDALARGADEAYLVSSRAFGGADTLATSYTLAKAIRHICGGAAPEIVFFGKQAIDGDTAQVGPGVSEFLDAALVTYVKKLDAAADGWTAETVMDDGDTTLAGGYPAVFTVLKEAPAPRFAPLAGAMAAAKAEIKILDEKTIGAEPAKIGLKGSPTKVVRIFPPPSRGGGEKFDARGDAKSAAEKIAEFMRGKGLAK
ncbi:MAG: electron transfer flavoprotein subunit beta/FixA family protein [Kiritimatiellae bacterium]|nr:electron transfer flavoprotein subunit beta/FixA family protein [Kiritimatiellia bacterium]